MEKGYYADGEHAYNMCKYFDLSVRPKVLPYNESDENKDILQKMKQKEKEESKMGEEEEEEDKGKDRNKVNYVESK